MLLLFRTSRTSSKGRQQKKPVGHRHIRFAQDMEYLVQYAAVDAISFSAPTALDDRLQIDVRGFKERAKVETRDGRTTWRVALQSKVLGVVTLLLLHWQR